MVVEKVSHDKKTVIYLGEFQMSHNKIKGLEDFEDDIHEKLVSNGYTNIKAISISIPENIVIDTGLSYRLAEEIISKSISLVVNPPLSAKEMLKLEQNKGKSHESSDLGNSGQLNFFSLDRPELEELADEIENVDVNQLKPIEALMLLNTFKEKLSKK